MSTPTIDRVERQLQLGEVAELLDRISGFTKKDAVDTLHTNYPWMSREFFNIRVAVLSRLSPEDFAHVLGYSDITGERAARNVDLERAS